MDSVRPEHVRAERVSSSSSVVEQEISDVVKELVGSAILAAMKCENGEKQLLPSPEKHRASTDERQHKYSR